MAPARRHYDEDEENFSGVFTIAGWGSGVAWRVLGWETEPDEDTEWSGTENRTGKVVAVMVGDDRHFNVDPEDLKPLARKDYCGECGQVGCGCDGYEEEEGT